MTDPYRLAYPDAIARPPVTPILWLPEGAYGAVRSSPEQGSCGIHPYPCTHPGVDLDAPKGTAVAAPHDGWVLVSMATNDPPFRGYGPAVVLLAHDDGRKLGAGGIDTLAQTLLHITASDLHPGIKTLRYSLLAHLDPDTLRYNLPWKQAVGLTDTDDSKRYQKLSDDTAARLTPWPAWAQYVKAGEFLGNIGDAGHVHWEVRNAPLREKGGLADVMDPLEWLHFYDPSVPWGTAKPSPVTPGRSSAGGLVELLIGGWLVAELLG